jgi:hypothetical protein
VEQAILVSPDYRRAHPRITSFVAGLNRDVLGKAGDLESPSQGGLRRHRGRVSADKLAHAFLASPAAAAILAEQDATTFLGRPATAEETQADAKLLRRDPAAVSRIAEQILSSDAFYEFVNSALPITPNPAHSGRHAHNARHTQRH